jgi:hypothetical protein
LTVSTPLPGAFESFVNESVAEVVGVPAWSAAVRTSVGVLELPVFQLKAFESYGPPEGVETVDGVCDQPPVVPPRALEAEEAGPDSASVTAFVSLKEPATEPR